MYSAFAADGVDRDDMRMAQQTCGRRLVPKAFELALTGSARLAWPVLQALNSLIPDGTVQPKWAPGPLLKSHERSKPPLGWPRTTDSLCPTCVREIR